MKKVSVELSPLFDQLEKEIVQMEVLASADQRAAVYDKLGDIIETCLAMRKIIK